MGHGPNMGRGRRHLAGGNDVHKNVSCFRGLLNAIFRQPMGWMARVAAAVQPSHIGDGRLWLIGLNLQRRNQRIFRVDDDAVGFSPQLEAYSELCWHRSSIANQARCANRRLKCGRSACVIHGSFSSFTMLNALQSSNLLLNAQENARQMTLSLANSV